MRLPGIGLLLLALPMLFTSAAHAECSKGVDCGEVRVAESSSATSERESDTEREHFFDEERPRRRRVKKRIGNPSLMIGGIVLASAAPAVLVIGIATAPPCSRPPCNLGGRVATFGLISLGLVGAAIPMIVIGAKRVPDRTVAVGPLLGRDIAGLQLQLW